MLPNNSPWLKQLNRTRAVVSINANLKVDVVIVGGGIAGVVSAFFILRDTDMTVSLIEADKIAHGATGHNAGQITSYFERPLSELVKEFGLSLAIEGQRSIEYGWTLLDQIIVETGTKAPVHRFTGYAGLSTLEQVLLHLKDNSYRIEGGLNPESMVIADQWEYLKDIPKGFKDLYTIAPQKDLLELLETNNADYIAALSSQKGCMNSALFSEELLRFVITTYKDRFSFYEGSPVRTVRLKKNDATLDVLSFHVEAKKIVLCTNGFENFSIINEVGTEIDTKFHHSIVGRIGYMSGYIEPLNNPPTAINYFLKTHNKSGDPTGEDYFYLTRRPHEHEGKDSYNLVCAGGPEKVLPNGATYSRGHYYSEDVKDLIEKSLQHNYGKYSKEQPAFAFSWHGLMGYTPNGIRRIGPEPCNPVLLYNLGCNGVGILPSIYGGKRISQFIRGERMQLSVFDPHDQG